MQRMNWRRQEETGRSGNFPGIISWEEKKRATTSKIEVLMENGREKTKGKKKGRILSLVAHRE